MIDNHVYNSWFSNNLLSWYEEHKRDLIWRSSRDPYTIWLSEIIFQQTRIDQGTKYFINFIRAYPNVQALASAKDDEVMKLWEGLGYYNRARNLLFTARLIVDKMAGVFPDSYHDLLQLKGVGEYTAAAISSICYSEVQAAVDGNVLRVLSRFYSDPTPIDASSSKKYFRYLAQGLIDPQKPGDFNQALMDLGSGVCTPRNPRCEDCPLRSRCASYKDATQADYPKKISVKTTTNRYLNFLVIQNQSEVIVRRRGANDIWPNLWEFPLIEGAYSCDELLTFVNQDYQLEIRKLPEPYSKIHLLSHQRLHIRIFRLDIKILYKFHFPDYERVSLKSLNQLAFPKPLKDYSLSHLSNL